MNYPIKRDLDGVYFRVDRNGGFDAICWTDLTDEERGEIGQDKTSYWWKQIALYLTETLREIGDQLDLVREELDDEGGHCFG